MFIYRVKDLLEYIRLPDIESIVGWVGSYKTLFRYVGR